ncbi:MAG: thiolase family protein [Acidimicrobiales bacterium]
MSNSAVIAGVGMTTFGKHLDRGLKSLGAEAIHLALADAGIEPNDIEAAWVGNAAAGLITGQESIRGQVVLRSLGIGGIPVINVENACASGSTAFHQATALVNAGAYDCVLALGMEKLFHEDKKRSFAAFSGAVDVEAMAEIKAGLESHAAESGAGTAASGAGKKRSLFMDIYAAAARSYMAKYGTTVEQLAAVSAKNSRHGALNERAQFREALTIEDVLSSPLIAEPLTRPMCSPIGDGAAAVVIVSPAKAASLGLTDPVRLRACILRSGEDSQAGGDAAAKAAQQAYEVAGIGPDDLDVIECHDASAPAELKAYDALGLCAVGDSGPLVESGATALGGRIPVNPSGGLLRKGHPVGATGLAQLVELTEQLQGRSGARQVEGARIALAHNGGGALGHDVAAMCVTVLSR